MLTVTFEHELDGNELTVVATCDDVDAYDADGLEIEILQNGEQLLTDIDEDDLFVIEQEAIVHLFNHKTYAELNFDR